jgi:alanyl-tRNA synthetase
MWVNRKDNRGGRKDLAEVGGKDPAKLDASLRALPSIVEKMLWRRRVGGPPS